MDKKKLSETDIRTKFITPAIVDRDPVTVAIGTEGAAPVLARAIKADLEERIAQEQRIIQELEEQFAAERFDFSREKVKLQFDLEEKVRLRKQGS